MESLIWKDETLGLLPERALFWERKGMLCLADLHLGKEAIFREHGLAGPGHTEREALDRLETLLNRLRPDRVVILGDLIHGRASLKSEAFRRFKEMVPRYELVAGNHDRWLDEGVATLFEAPFLLTHDTAYDERPQILGHLHPRAVLSSGHDRIRLPCFLLEENRLHLPAFTSFSAGFPIEPAVGLRIFAIADGGVSRLQG